MARKQRGRQKVSPGKPLPDAHKSKSQTDSIVPRSSRGAKRSVTPASWTLRRFNALSTTQQDTYFRAKHILRQIREGKSASQAARDNETSLATAQRYFPADFFKKKGSRQWSVSPSDNHVNQVQWLGKSGY